MAKGQPNRAVEVALPSHAYLSLIEAARDKMPTASAGALAGYMQFHDAEEQGRSITIASATFLTLRPSGLAQAIDEAEWADLKSRLAAEGNLCIVGWFYADPGLAIFPPRIDICETQRALASDTDLFLLLNPAIDEGAFFRWRGDGFVPLEGFYEAMPHNSSPSVIPWQGEVRGAAAWLQMSSTITQPVAEPLIEPATDTVPEPPGEVVVELVTEPPPTESLSPPPADTYSSPEEATDAAQDIADGFPATDAYLEAPEADDSPTAPLEAPEPPVEQAEAHIEEQPVRASRSDMQAAEMTARRDALLRAKVHVAPAVEEQPSELSDDTSPATPHQGQSRWKVALIIVVALAIAATLLLLWLYFG